MTGTDQGFFSQIRRNSVALISIIIAVTSLSYNTWRNEVTEDNRNQRFAAFEVLMKLGQLQQVVFHNHYDSGEVVGLTPRAGWTYVLTIRDLSRVTGEDMTTQAESLYAVWRDNWQHLGNRQQQDKVDTITDAIEQMREVTIAVITALE